MRGAVSMALAYNKVSIENGKTDISVGFRILRVVLLGKIHFDATHLIC